MQSFTILYANLRKILCKKWLLSIVFSNLIFNYKVFSVKSICSRNDWVARMKNYFFRVVSQSISQPRFLGKGVQPRNTAGPIAHNQIGPRATPACVKLCGLDNSMGTYGKIDNTLQTAMVSLKVDSGPFHGDTKVQLSSQF